MGHCSVALFLLASMVMTLLTTSKCINNNTNTSGSSGGASWCNGLNDPSCLIAHTDRDLEFMMDSEISRRILAGVSYYTKNSFDPGKATSCDRIGFPPCHPDTNRNPPPPRCDKTRFNRECFRY